MLLFLGVIIAFVNTELYALLWAGIHPWDYLAYPSEAHMYQTYHQLISNGVSEENIITFGMDSAAHNEKNLQPGNVHAYFGGPNVYPDFKFDYVYHNNTPENIYKVLNNEPTGVGSGRTFSTTEEDDILIAGFNHGDSKCLAFIYELTEKKYDVKFILAEDLNKNLVSMKEKKLFRNIIFLTTACHSGSMFNGILNETIGVYAMTSAPPSVPALTCDNDKSVGAVLNSCFGKAWQNYSRMAKQSGEMFEKTMYDEYKFAFDHRMLIPGYVNESYCEYGDLSIRDKYIGIFQSKKDQPQAKEEEEEKKMKKSEKELFDIGLPNYLSMKQVLIDRDPKKKRIWEDLESLFGNFNGKKEIYDPKICKEGYFGPDMSHLESISKERNCFEKVSNFFDKNCGKLYFYDLQNLRLFWDVCENNGGMENVLLKTLSSLCK